MRIHVCKEFVLSFASIANGLCKFAAAAILMDHFFNLIDSAYCAFNGVD